MPVAAGFSSHSNSTSSSQLRSLESVAAHLSTSSPEAFLPHACRWLPRWRKAWFQIIEVDHLPLTTFSWLPPLFLSAIANIRQGLHNPPRTTPGVEEFPSSRPGLVFIPHPVSYTEPLTMALGVIISFLKFCARLRFSLASCSVSSNCCFCLTYNRGMSVATLAVSNLRIAPNSKIASLRNISG